MSGGGSGRVLPIVQPITSNATPGSAGAGSLGGARVVIPGVTGSTSEQSTSNSTGVVQRPTTNTILVNACQVRY